MAPTNHAGGSSVSKKKATYQPSFLSVFRPSSLSASADGAVCSRTVKPSCVKLSLSMQLGLRGGVALSAAAVGFGLRA
eukprot:3707714-Pleurochrysis_carterae.AAC.1